MKKILLGLAAAGMVLVSNAQTLDDIQFWAGSGANRAAMVIDWNDGKTSESLVWGYRWDGSATGADMFLAIVAADPRLFAHLGTFNFGFGDTPGIFGIGYDVNDNGSFGVSASPSLTFGAGGLTIDSLATGDDNVDITGTPLDAADHWVESWYPADPYWSYYTKEASGDAWVSSFIGASDRSLADGSWDGWSLVPSWESPIDPGVPAIAPVPEPTTFALCVAGGGIWLLRRRLTRKP